LARSWAVDVHALVFLLLPFAGAAAQPGSRANLHKKLRRPLASTLGIPEMSFTRTWLASLALVTLAPLIFICVQLALFIISGWLVDWWFFNNDPSWYDGPLGGIHQIPVFLVLIPFSLWRTVVLWRRLKQVTNRAK
jgi:hypothetical protein